MKCVWHWRTYLSDKVTYTMKRMFFIQCVNNTYISNRGRLQKGGAHMNNFRLPYHLIVQEGIFERVDEVMADCVPDIKNKKLIIVTDANLQTLFGDIIKALQADFRKSEV